MFEIIGEMGLASFIFLGVACFFAAFIDAIAGGGGLISLPAFLASGLPAHVALGTNKMAACCGTVASSLKFARSGKVNWVLMRKLVIFSFIGSMLGVKTVVMINPKYLYPIAIILLIMVLGYTLCNKSLGEENHFEGLNSQNIKFGIIMAFVMGFYDGFFGPGTGSFLIFALIRIFKLDFTNASGNAKILNLTSNFSGLLMFFIMGQINFIYGIIMAVLMICGAVLGAKMAVKKGAKFIKPIFLIVTTVVLIKMVAETIFGINMGIVIKNIILSLM